MMRTHSLFFALICMVFIAAGCSVVPLDQMAAKHSFFVLDAEQVKQYETLAQEADRLLASCRSNHSCDRAHYIRGIVALYENRDIAASHFRAAAAAAPEKQSATSSGIWLDLLKETAPYSARGPFGRVTTQLAKELIAQEFLMRQVMQSNDGINITALKRELQAKDKRLDELTKALESSTLTALKREIKARDKKLEDLARQIEALKDVDLEMRENTFSHRPPVKSNAVLKKAAP